MSSIYLSTGAWENEKGWEIGGSLLGCWVKPPGLGTSQGIVEGGLGKKENKSQTDSDESMFKNK